MAENSRSEVTITLGGRGQVVKKAGLGLDSSYGDSQSAVERKRPVRERLGGDVDMSTRHISKRVREDGSGMHLSATNAINDMGLSKGDLRYQIMRKNMRNKNRSSGQQSGLDLRDMLSRPARSSTTSITRHQQRTEGKVAGPHMTEARHSRDHLRELKDIGFFMAEPNSLSMMGPVPSTSLGALAHLGIAKNAYSPWTLEKIKRRSPEGVVSSFRRFSPQRREEELRRRSPGRSHDDTRVDFYMRKDLFEISHPVTSSTHSRTSASHLQTSASYMTTATLSPFVPQIPPGRLVQKSSYAGQYLYTEADG